MEALKTQVGGNHYKSMKIQPIELISKLNLNYFQGNIVKYISRDKENKIEDLEKAKHYCELAIELDKKDNVFKKFFIRSFTNKTTIAKQIALYCHGNKLRNRESFIIGYIFCKEYQEAIKELNITIDQDIYGLIINAIIHEK